MAGSGLLLLGTVAAWRGWVWLQTNLTPWLETELTTALERPVELGDLERLTLSGVRVGPSQIPATATDPDTLSLQGIEVQVNLWDLLRRELILNVVVDQAELHLEQAADGQWVNLDLAVLQRDTPDRDPWLQVQPGTVRWRESRATLVPYHRRPTAAPLSPRRTTQADRAASQPSAGQTAPDAPHFALTAVHGEVTFLQGTAGLSEGRRPQIQSLEVDVRGTSVVGGHVHAKGAVQLPSPETSPSDGEVSGPGLTHPPGLGQSWLGGWQSPAIAQSVDPGALDPEAMTPLRANLTLRVRKLTAPDLQLLAEMALGQPLPATLTAGTLSGTVDVMLGEDAPTLTGTARLEGVTIDSTRLPEPIQALQGDVRLQGRRIVLEAFTARLADLTARVGGTLDLDQGYALTGRVNPFTVAQLTDLLGVTLPVPVAGTFRTDVTVAGPFTQPVISTALTSQGRVTVDRLALSTVQANATLQGQRLTFETLRLLPEAGGSLTGQGTLDLRPSGQLALTLTGDRLPADALGQPYGLPGAVSVGPVFLNASLDGPLDQLRGQARWRAPLGAYPAQGRVAWADETLTVTDTFVQVAEGTLAAEGSLALDRRQWQADLRATGLSLATLGAGLEGEINGRGEFQGPLGPNALADVVGQGIAQAQIAEGGVVNGRATVGQGRWQATVVGHHLALTAFSSPLQGTGRGQFEFSGSTDALTLAAVRGQGQVELSDGLATLAAFAPQLAVVREPLWAEVAWDGQSVQVEGARTAGLQASGVITPGLDGPEAPRLKHLDLTLAARQVNLAAFPVPGQILPVTGVGSFDGRLVGTLGTLRLTGAARLEDLALSQLAFATPLTGPVVYDQRQGFTVDLRDPSQRETGDRLLATSQQAPYDLKFTVRQGPSLADGHIQGSHLWASLTHLPLDDLHLPQGGVAGVGTLSGTVESAVISGNWREPNLQAQFDIHNPGLGYLSLGGTQVMASAVGDPTLPLSRIPPDGETLEVRYGRLRGTLHYTNQWVNLREGELVTPSQDSRYFLQGTYALDGSKHINGELAVVNANIQDILRTFKIFELADFRPDLMHPPTWFRPSGGAESDNLTTTQVGDRNATLLDQLRRFAEVQALQDIRTAEAEAVRFPPLEGLEGRFSGTVTAKGALPNQVQVDVDVNGSNWHWQNPRYPTSVAYHLDSLVAQATYADGLLRLRPVRLSGSFPSDDPTTPTLATVDLNGDLSLRPEDPVERTLRLNITDLPLAAVRHPLGIPETFDGVISGGASLTGSLLADPQIRGRLAINKATINRQPIEGASADFLYQQARLTLRSDLSTQGEVDPLTLLASLPLPMAGSRQKPSHDDVTVRLRMKDEGFALMNLFTQAVTWETGKAELALNVDGSWPVDKPFGEALTSLVVTGSAHFDGVTLSSRSLPEPLTNLRGEVAVLEGSENENSVYLNGLVLDVKNLQGDFSAGQVTADGHLKVVPSIHDLFPGVVSRPSTSGGHDTTAVVDPLKVTLDNIALDLRHPVGTYRGSLNGEVVVGGSLYLLDPQISGNLRLANGIITLPEAPDDTALLAGGFFGNASPSVYRPLPPVLNNFSITLAENVRLGIPQVLDVTTRGDLYLVGTVPDIKPVGRIQLPAGRVNLFTTEFRLTGNQNYAEFSAKDDRIDPHLVASLSAAVSDTLGNSTSLTAATPFPRIEIIDDPISQLGLTQNGVQTIRIRANVNGRASRVLQLQGVELSSTPPRSEREIISLISNEFLTAIESTLGSVSGGGDNFQGLLAFAGSAILNRLQNLIGAGMDNTELRLYSASPPGSQQVDVGGEISFNLSPSLGLSMQKVFTNVTPVLVGVRYRITDQITVRGVTSYEQFDENTGAIVEFRF